MKNNLKYKPKKRRVIKTGYIVILLIVVLLCLSTSYSFFSTTLTITGNVKLNKEDPDLPIEIVTPSGGETSEDGSARLSANTSMSFLGIELYKVESESSEENEVITNLRQSYKATFGFTTATPTITLSLENSTSVDFTNGKVTLVESKDNNNCFQNSSASISTTMIPAGSSATVTITGRIRANKSPANGTYYKYAITYDVNGVTRYLYYTINFLPMN